MRGTGPQKGFSAIWPPPECGLFHNFDSPFTISVADLAYFCVTSWVQIGATISSRDQIMRSPKQLLTTLCALFASLLWLSAVTQAQFTVGSGNAQQVPDIANEGSGPLDPAQPTGISIQEIIQKFTAKED